MKQFKTILFLAIPILLVMTPIAAFGIGNIRLSNGTLIPDVNRPSWMGNGTLVATTNFTCHNGNCVGGGWVPIPNNTTDDWKCHMPDPYCHPWWTNNSNNTNYHSPLTGNSNNSTSNSTDGGRCVQDTCEIDELSYQEANVQQVSIYICGHYRNGTAEWCW
jgi:hypothetical protein